MCNKLKLLIVSSHTCLCRPSQCLTFPSGWLTRCDLAHYTGVRVLNFRPVALPLPKIMPEQYVLAGQPDRVEYFIISGSRAIAQVSARIWLTLKAHTRDSSEIFRHSEMPIGLASCGSLVSLAVIVTGMVGRPCWLHSPDIVHGLMTMMPSHHHSLLEFLIRREVAAWVRSNVGLRGTTYLIMRGQPYHIHGHTAEYHVQIIGAWSPDCFQIYLNFNRKDGDTKKSLAH
jgi:hypothetical protein